LTRILYTEKERKRREALGRFANAIRNKAVNIARVQAEKMKKEQAMREFQKQKYWEAYRDAYQKAKINEIKMRARRDAKRKNGHWFSF
jgi:patatin-like phospholipase/acyl hydrolase